MNEKAQVEEKITSLECYIECFGEVFEKINNTKLNNKLTKEVYFKKIYLIN